MKGYYAVTVHQAYNTPDWYTYRYVGSTWQEAEANVLPGEGTPVWFDAGPND